jgi:tetratricopeptide (TPR) repeat protein
MKSNGEMLLVALMPPQPAHDSNPHKPRTHRKLFQCLFTNRTTIIPSLILATPIYCGVRAAGGDRWPLKAVFLPVAKIILLAFTILLLGGEASLAMPAAAVGPDPALVNRTKKAFEAAKLRFQTETNNAEAQWQFGRAAFDWAEFATNNAQRIEIAQQGIEACRKLIATDPKSAPAHYYLGLDLGRVADSKHNIEGLTIVDQMESEFTIVLGLDPLFDYGGANRNLGLLYCQAPGWPISIGSKAKARQHLQDAIKRAPGYPENHLNLIEALIKWGEKPAAVQQLKALDDIWADAQKKLTGEDWTASWADWEKRRNDARSASSVAPKTVATPRK